MNINIFLIYVLLKRNMARKQCTLWRKIFHSKITLNHYLKNIHDVRRDACKEENSLSTDKEVWYAILRCVGDKDFPGKSETVSID